MSMPNSEYWKQRFTQLEEARNRRADEAVVDMIMAYRRAQKQLEAEVNRWYLRFMDNNGIVSMADARIKLTKGELAEFKWDVREYLKYAQDNMVSGQWEKQLENASARYHISRLEALRVNSAAVIEELYNWEERSLELHLMDEYEDDYYSTMYEVQKGYDTYFDVAALNSDAVEKILKKPWAPDKYNFSERIWRDKDRLINIVHKELMTCMLIGEPLNNVISRLTKAMGVERYNAERLARTELLAAANMATQDCYRALGVEKYEVTEALDDKTCDICASLDGKVFEQKDAQIGLNYPPFHPNCRGATVPHFDKKYGLESSRAARDADGNIYYVDSDMKYPEWKKVFVDKEMSYEEWRQAHGKNNSFDDLNKGKKKVTAKSSKTVDKSSEKGYNKGRGEKVASNGHKKKSDIIETDIQSDLGELKKKLQSDKRVSNEYYTAVKDKFSHGSDIAKKAFTKYVPENSILNSEYEGVAYYDDEKKKISMHFYADLMNNRGKAVTWFHEHGHMIDDMAGNISNNDEFRTLLNDDYLSYIKKYGKEHMIEAIDRIHNSISDELSSMREHSAVSDLLNGISDGSIKGVAFHEPDYWKKENILCAEAFAHMYEAQFDKIRYAQMKKYFPSALKKFEEILKGAI